MWILLGFKSSFQDNIAGVEQLVARWDHSPKVIRSSRISATIVGVATLFLPSMWRMGIRRIWKMADVVYAPD